MLLNLGHFGKRKLYAEAGEEDASGGGVAVAERDDDQDAAFTASLAESLSDFQAEEEDESDKPDAVSYDPRDNSKGLRPEPDHEGAIPTDGVSVGEEDGDIDSSVVDDSPAPSTPEAGVSVDEQMLNEVASLFQLNQSDIQQLRSDPEKLQKAWIVGAREKLNQAYQRQQELEGKGKPAVDESVESEAAESDTDPYSKIKGSLEEAGFDDLLPMLDLMREENESLKQQFSKHDEVLQQSHQERRNQAAAHEEALFLQRLSSTGRTDLFGNEKGWNETQQANAMNVLESYHDLVNGDTARGRQVDPDTLFQRAFRSVFHEELAKDAVRTKGAKVAKTAALVAGSGAPASRNPTEVPGPVDEDDFETHPAFIAMREKHRKENGG